MSDGIVLGDRVKHRFCPFTGTVIGRAEYTGTGPQVHVVSSQLEKGEPVAKWLEEGLLTVVPPPDAGDCLNDAATGPKGLPPIGE